MTAPGSSQNAHGPWAQPVQAEPPFTRGFAADKSGLPPGRPAFTRSKAGALDPARGKNGCARGTHGGGRACGPKKGGGAGPEEGGRGAQPQHRGRAGPGGRAELSGGAGRRTGGGAGQRAGGGGDGRARGAARGPRSGRRPPRRRPHAPRSLAAPQRAHAAAAGPAAPPHSPARHFRAGSSGVNRHPAEGPWGLSVQSPCSFSPHRCSLPRL